MKAPIHPALSLSLLVLSAPLPAQQSARIEGFADAVKSLVDEGHVVGAEILVIEDGNVLLEEAHGWKDREEGEALEVGSLFRLRSMTKPILGTLAQVLVDDGRLELGRPVFDYLPVFDEGDARRINVLHLLTHRSGLPWMVCMDGPTLESLAECCARIGPREFLPGTSFLYSNAGSNALAALVASVAGTSLEEAVAASVLEPLGLDDTLPFNLATEEHVARVVSRYVRSGEDEWQRAWSPSDGIDQPFMPGSYGLIGTARDYARFLTLWMEGGAIDGTRLLSTEAVERGLTPHSLALLPSTFPGRRNYYGQHWRLWTRGDSNRVEIFGHSGSDGTFAWAFPDRDLLVLFFTQCVNTTAGVELEEEMDRWLLREEGPVVPPELAELVGHYWNEEKQFPRTVYADREGRLTIEVPETATFTLEVTDDPLVWQVVGQNSTQVRFELDEDDVVTTLVPPAMTGESPSVRWTPDPGLPTVDALMALRFGGEETGSLGDLGVFRMAGTFETSMGQTGSDVLLSDGELRSREEVQLSRRGAEATVCNLGRVCTVSTRGRRKLVTGDRAEAILMGRLSVLVGDWRRFFAGAEVLAQIRRDERDLVIVRCVSEGGAPQTFLVDAETGRPVEGYTTVMLPFGRMARIQSYGDWREVEGRWIPFLWESRYASEAMGTAKVQYETIETHVKPEPGAFSVEG